MRAAIGALALVPLALASGQDRATGPTVIAVLPTEFSRSIAQPDSIRWSFDSLVAATLAQAGYTVVTNDVAHAAWIRSVDSLGGYYDRGTGALIAAKLRAARAVTLRRLNAEFGAEALVTPIVIVHSVLTNQGVARWDGITQRVAGMGWAAVDVLSLRVVTTDTAGSVFQCESGGIRATVDYSMWSGRARPLPADQYFRDRERNAAAVRRALASLVAHAPACDSP